MRFAAFTLIHFKLILFFRIRVGVDLNEANKQLISKVKTTKKQKILLKKANKI